MIKRTEHLQKALGLLRAYPAVAILGPRQIGKTTLAGLVGRKWKGPVTRFDLEDPTDLYRLNEPKMVLEPLRGLVVIDEVQKRPELFSYIRVLADQRQVRRRFLILGSASPSLLRQSSETLAGRIAYHTLGGLDMFETGAASLEPLWLRGGFPRSFLAKSEKESVEWRRNFVRTFLEQDIPQLGISIPAGTMRRFWSLLAHYHGQIWNSSEPARSFGMADTTIKRYLDILTDTFMVRQLAPWHENLKKRQVKSPKVYFMDTGLLHLLMDAPDKASLLRHPKQGASWEGFMMEMVIRRTGAWPEECYFWATHAGAEIDLLVVRGGKRYGFEFKRTANPQVTPSMRIGQKELNLKQLWVIHAGKESFDLPQNIRAVAAAKLREIPHL